MKKKKHRMNQNILVLNTCVSDLYSLECWPYFDIYHYIHSTSLYEFECARDCLLRLKRAQTFKFNSLLHMNWTIFVCECVVFFYSPTTATVNECTKGHKTYGKCMYTGNMNMKSSIENERGRKKKKIWQSGNLFLVSH